MQIQEYVYDNVSLWWLFGRPMLNSLAVLMLLYVLRLWMKQAFARSRQQEERHVCRTKGLELASACGGVVLKQTASGSICALRITFCGGFPLGQATVSRSVLKPATFSVAIRTTAPPKLDKDRQQQFMEKAKALAPKYRTELLKEA